MRYKIRSHLGDLLYESDDAGLAILYFVTEATRLVEFFQYEKNFMSKDAMTAAHVRRALQNKELHIASITLGEELLENVFGRPALAFSITLEEEALDNVFGRHALAFQAGEVDPYVFVTLEGMTMDLFTKIGPRSSGKNILPFNRR